ncbi:MAG: glycosyltransferase family 4 protein [Gammaproteobacteria bacterium]|nr:LPS biosynthesis transferase [Gammaproteobacteria bacterium]
MRRLNILTWHVHGNYLYYLCRVPHTIYLPVKPGRPEGYGGRLPGLPWGPNVIDVPADKVADLDLDVIVFQSRKNYFEDQYEILSAAQRRLPRIFIEHDPPRDNPTDTRHPVDDPDVLLVHVTPFNALMWDAGATPVRVIEHGVEVPAEAEHTGELERGIVVVNGLAARGRRLGADVFERVREYVPLDLAGIGSEALGGLGEVPHAELPKLMARYRFFFNPIRYTSLGLAVCEAMAVGLPVIGLATTEMVTVVENGVSGYVETRFDRLIAHMQRLLAYPDEAARLGAGARKTAERRFSIERFVRDWNDAFEEVVRSRTHRTDEKAARRLRAHA